MFYCDAHWIINRKNNLFLQTFILLGKISLYWVIFCLFLGGLEEVLQFTRSIELSGNSIMNSQLFRKETKNSCVCSIYYALKIQDLRLTDLEQSTPAVLSSTVASHFLVWDCVDLVTVVPAKFLTSPHKLECEESNIVEPKKVNSQ